MLAEQAQADHEMVTVALSAVASPPGSADRRLVGALESLAGASWAASDAASRLAAQVAAARACGASWAAVGAVVGMTGEGARKRWRNVR